MPLVKHAVDLIVCLCIPPLANQLWCQFLWLKLRAFPVNGSINIVSRMSTLSLDDVLNSNMHTSASQVLFASFHTIMNGRPITLWRLVLINAQPLAFLLLALNLGASFFLSDTVSSANSHFSKECCMLSTFFGVY
jgi:hypothetical protein